jgi:hypothetical protein
MDIHRPKPFHGWRELAKEIGVIVVGVLIALAAEQLVEQMRWEHAVYLGRQSLHDEIAWNNGFFRDRVIMAPCLQRRIDRAEALVESAGPTGSVGRFTDVAAFAGRSIETSEWESERASGTLTHFPRTELKDLGRYYAQIEPGMRDWIAVELDAWTRLSILENGPKRLSDADIAELRVAVETARRMEYLVTLNARRELDRSKSWGVKPVAVGNDQIRRMCEPVGVKLQLPVG